MKADWYKRLHILDTLGLWEMPAEDLKSLGAGINVFVTWNSSWPYLRSTKALGMKTKNHVGKTQNNKIHTRWTLEDMAIICNKNWISPEWK